VLAAPRSPGETSVSFLRGVATAVPQLSQNLATGETAVPHSAHAMARILPQLAQYLAPSRFSFPHDEHRILPTCFAAVPEPQRSRQRRLSQHQIMARRSSYGLKTARVVGSAHVRQRRGPTYCVRSMRMFAPGCSIQPKVPNVEDRCLLGKHHVSRPIGANELRRAGAIRDTTRHLANFQCC
jgi:hypothetical protein